MTKDCKHSIKLLHIHMEQMLLKYVKVKCEHQKISMNKNVYMHNIDKSYNNKLR